jgi:glycosyltransferase involved in cell wall biosynthesis
MLPGWQEEVERVWRTKKGGSFLSDLRWALRLYLSAPPYDAVVTGFERSAWLFALLRRVTFTRRPRHVILDAHPALSANPMARAVRKWLFKQVFLSAQSVVVFSKKQRDLWAELFGISAEHFTVIPYWATAAAESRENAGLGDYIFAGGDESRDYATLIEAVRGLPYGVSIAAMSERHFRGIDLPANVTVKTMTHEAFMRTLAGAGLVVVPLLKNTIRFAGQQTYLNAMMAGRPVIVADRGADEYIESGVNGIIVEPGDVIALRAAIIKLMCDRETAAKIASAGSEAARGFTADRYFTGVLGEASRL